MVGFNMVTLLHPQTNLFSPVPAATDNIERTMFTRKVSATVLTLSRRELKHVSTPMSNSMSIFRKETNLINTKAPFCCRQFVSIMHDIITQIQGSLATLLGLFKKKTSTKTYHAIFLNV